MSVLDKFISLGFSVSTPDSKIIDCRESIKELIADRDALAVQVEQLTADRDAFAIRLEDSEEQYSELHNRNSALAAQVDVQLKVIEYAHNKLYILSHNRKDVSARCLTDADKGFKAVDDYLSANKSPQQCLAEIKAEAVLQAVEFFSPARDIDVEALETYAAKIRNTGTWLKDSNVNGGKRQGGEK